MDKFIPRHQYRFIKDFVFDLGYPMPRIECHIGDVAEFDCKNMGMGRFYVKQGGNYSLILVKPQEAFRVFEEA